MHASKDDEALDAGAIIAEIMRLEHAIACDEARAERLEKEAETLRQSNAISRQRSARLSGLLA